MGIEVITCSATSSPVTPKLHSQPRKVAWVDMMKLSRRRCACVERESVCVRVCRGVMRVAWLGWCLLVCASLRVYVCVCMYVCIYLLKRSHNPLDNQLRSFGQFGRHNTDHRRKHSTALGSVFLGVHDGASQQPATPHQVQGEELGQHLMHRLHVRSG